MISTNQTHVRIHQYKFDGFCINYHRGTKNNTTQYVTRPIHCKAGGFQRNRRHTINVE